MHAVNRRVMDHQNNMTKCISAEVSVGLSPENLA